MERRVARRWCCRAPMCVAAAACKHRVNFDFCWLDRALTGRPTDRPIDGQTERPFAADLIQRE